VLNRKLTSVWVEKARNLAAGRLPFVALLPAFVILFVPLVAMSPTPKQSAWEVIGPGGGGALFEPTVDPNNPNRILVACDMTGSYLSSDAGQTWKMFNLRGRVRFFVFDTNDANVIYARSIGLWRSEDGGQQWRLIYPDAKTVKTVAMSDDHAGETLVTNDPAGAVDALAVDPADSSALYAAIQKQHVESLYQSKDRGKSWGKLFDLPSAARRIYVDPRSPREDRTLYVAGKNSIGVREHGKWREGPSPAGVGEFTNVSLSFAAASAVIYATSSNGLFVSEDGGASWKASPLPGTGARVRAVASSSGDPNVAYVSYSNLKTGWLGTGWFANTWLGNGKEQFGVAKTADRGKSWELVWAETASEANPHLHDAWITPVFGPDFGGNPIALTVAAGDSKIVYSTDLGRILRSSDGGKSWDAIYSTRRQDGTVAGRGIETTTSYGVFFDPFDHKRMFIAYSDIGLFRSEDAGQSWTSSLSGVPRKWWNSTYWMVFDPDVHGKVWAAMSAVHDLPRVKMWQRKQPSSYEGGVVVSNDGGKSWQRSSNGMPPAAVTHILLDPKSSVQARMLYVAAVGRGVYKSTDGGANWTLKNAGIASAEPLAWRLQQDTGGTLYLVVARRTEDGSIGNDGDGALYRSTDGAEHWEKVKLPDGVNGSNGLAIDPKDPKRLYLAAWGRNTPPRVQGGGIYLSTDAGKSWRNVLSRDQHVYDVTIDPRDPEIVYATGFESSAWRSADKSVTWKRIAGFNFKWGHRVIPDPSDAGKVFITTFGSSVWHGPAQGDAGTPDEIATPEVAHGK